MRHGDCYSTCTLEEWLQMVIYKERGERLVIR